MKKLIIILIAAVSINAASAQSRNDHSRDHRQITQKDSRNDNGQRHSNDYTYSNNNGWKNDRDRQEAYDRMNKQYDQRIDGYRNDRSLSPYERDRKIREAGQEREQISRSFGTALVVGGIAGILAGLLAGH